MCWNSIYRGHWQWRRRRRRRGHNRSCGKSRSRWSIAQACTASCSRQCPIRLVSKRTTVVNSIKKFVFLGKRTGVHYYHSTPFALRTDPPSHSVSLIFTLGETDRQKTKQMFLIDPIKRINNINNYWILHKVLTTSEFRLGKNHIRYMSKYIKKKTLTLHI